MIPYRGMHRRFVSPGEAARLLPTYSGRPWGERDDKKSEALAKAMRDGTFDPERGEGVRVIDGKLCNGRHRLRAVVLVGQPVEIGFTKET